MMSVSPNAPGVVPPPCPAPPPPATRTKVNVAQNLAMVRHKESDQSSAVEISRRLCKDRLESPESDFERLEGSEDNAGNVLSHHIRVTPIVQEGPQCGLVALCMASQLLPNTTSVDEVATFQMALELNYTKQGEMFSAVNMLSLAQRLLGCQGEVVPTLEVTAERLWNALVQKQAVLVPYDRDHNNEPCCKKGQKAHWVLLTGFLVRLKSLPESFKAVCVKDEEFPHLHHLSSLPPKCDQEESSLFHPQSNAGDLYVFANQGKSIRTHLWKWSELVESNAQLIQIGSKIQADAESYILPPEGNISAGLCGKIVFLHS